MQRGLVACHEFCGVRFRLRFNSGRWGRDFAGRLVRVRVLVAFEARDLDVAHPRDLIAHDHACLGQLVNELGTVDGVVREDLGLKAQRPLLEAAFAVGDAPQPLEEQARPWRRKGQLVAREEARLEDARSHATPFAANS